MVPSPSTPPRCVTPRRKRTWTPASITNAYSAKRRRVSMASVDWTGEIEAEVEPQNTGKATVADRFISAPQECALPLNITPRTNRIARTFGLADDRVLKFSEGAGSSGSQDMSLQRSQLQRLFAAPPATPQVSAIAHLGARKQFILALDGPGIPEDTFAFPLSWSTQNDIAVACGRDLYYQNLDTREIIHLGTVEKRSHGRLSSIEWCVDKPTILAAGTSVGVVHLWDAETQSTTQEWRCEDWTMVGGMHWKGDLLAAGVGDGSVELFDRRKPEAAGRLTAHRCRVHGVRWSPDQNYLATSDNNGVVHVWDARALRPVTDTDKKAGKLKHNQGPVKALAWCPWKPDLLATGSTYPDGKIRIWSITGGDVRSPSMPLHTLSFDTAVTSLVWAPHCKELLSTHGSAWKLRSASTSTLPHVPHARNSAASFRVRAVPARSAYMNSLTVHAYPSMRHVLSVPAHSGAVGHSCLSPDGTMVFTICPAEEAMKMWRVWGAPKKAERRESAFDKCAIR